MEAIEQKIEMLERNIQALAMFFWDKKIEEFDMDFGKKLLISSKLDTAASAVAEVLRLFGVGSVEEAY